MLYPPPSRYWPSDVQTRVRTELFGNGSTGRPGCASRTSQPLNRIASQQKCTAAARRSGDQMVPLWAQEYPSVFGEDTTVTCWPLGNVRVTRGSGGGSERDRGHSRQKQGHHSPRVPSRRSGKW